MLNSEYLKLADEGAGSLKDNQSPTISATSSTEIITKKEEPTQLASVASDSQASPVPSAPKPELVADLCDQKTECDSNELMSHCSAAGSCFSESGADKNSRLFIFPQNCPGFEVVYPVLDVAENAVEEYKWSESSEYCFSIVTEFNIVKCCCPAERMKILSFPEKLKNNFFILVLYLFFPIISKKKRENKGSVQNKFYSVRYIFS